HSSCLAEGRIRTNSERFKTCSFPAKKETAAPGLPSAAASLICENASLDAGPIYRVCPTQVPPLSVELTPVGQVVLSQLMVPNPVTDASPVALVRSAPTKFTPVKFEPALNTAFCKFADPSALPERSAPLKLAPVATNGLESVTPLPSVKSTLVKWVPVSVAVKKVTPLTIASVRLAPVRLAPARIAPVRFALIKTAFCRFAPDKLAPTKLPFERIVEAPPL